MNHKLLTPTTALAATLLLSASCHSKSTWDKERVIASEAGSYALKSKAKTVKVPFVIEDEIAARKAILAYLEANYPTAFAKGLEGADSIKVDKSDGKISFYVIVKIDTAQVAIFAPKGGSEITEAAIDMRLLK